MFFNKNSTLVVSRHLDDIFQTIIIRRIRNTDIDNRVIRNMYINYNKRDIVALLLLLYL